MTKPDNRVLFAFDGSSLSRRGVQLIATSPLLKGLPIHLLMVGKTQSQGTKPLEDAAKTLRTAGFTVSTEMKPGDPEAVIPDTVASQSFDLLIMGEYSHSPWRSLFMGSKTSDLLKKINTTILLLR